MSKNILKLYFSFVVHRFVSISVKSLLMRLSGLSGSSFKTYLFGPKLPKHLSAKPNMLQTSMHKERNEWEDEKQELQSDRQYLMKWNSDLKLHRIFIFNDKLAKQ